MRYSQTRDESMMPLGFFITWLAITVMWWGLALTPLPATPPAWLVVARQVCFGATPTGLPEAYGWLGLFGVPGSLLGFLVVVWGRQLRQNFQAMRRRRSGRVVLAMLVVTPLFGTVWVGQRIVTATQMTAALAPASPTTPLPEDYPRLHRPAPALHLLDQHGRTTTLTDQHGTMLVLTFAFAHCQTLCSPVVQTARAAVEAVPGTTLWIVTLDPWRDTPGALPGLALRWGLQGEHMRLLSGDVETVLATLAAYNVPYQRHTRTGDITHPALVYIIDDTGHITYAFDHPSRSWLVAALRRLFAPSPLMGEGRGEGER